MKILYISTVNSNKKYNILFEKSNGELHHSIQKFHQLIISGLAKNNNDVTVLSGLQISNKVVNKKIFLSEKEKENEITYLYPFLINLPILKQIFTIFSFIFYFITWCIKNKGDKRVIVDSAYISVAPIMVFLSNLFNINCACIVADIYNYMTLNVNTNQKRSFFEKISCKFCNYCWNNYDYFILLTEEMSKIINPLNKPCIVMEGLVDNKNEVKNKKIKKKQAIMYAGGLTERYGVKLLIDAFNKWDNKDYELWLCGSGDLVDYIKSRKNNKIKFFGTLPNKDIIKLEKEATLLVNPRFSGEEYTKYSFPSKNMEYMLSGTPVLTTNLPGMPDEYKKYVYLEEDETIDGYIDTFNKLLVKNVDDLNKKGREAQEFVRQNKNNIVQTKRIVDFISDSNNKKKKFSLELFQKIFLILITFMSIFPSGSNKYVFFISLIGLFLTICISDKKSVIEFIKKYKLCLFFICLWFFVFFISYFFGNSERVLYYAFSYIRIVTILIISLYYLYKKDYTILKTVVIFSFLIINIINVYTTICNLNYYNLSRLLSTGIAIDVNSYGIASYVYIYGLIYVIFALLPIYFKSKNKFLLITIITSLITIFVTEFLIAIILLFAGIIFYLFKLYNIKRLVISIIFIILFFACFSKPLSSLFHLIGDTFSNSYNISVRMHDIGYFLEGELDKTIDLKERLSDYTQSIKIFKENIFFGTAFNNKSSNVSLGGHSTFFDELASYGIIGIIPLIIMLFYLFRSIFNLLHINMNRNIFSICIIVFIMFCILNNAFFVTIFYLLFLIVPFILKINERRNLNENHLGN